MKTEKEKDEEVVVLVAQYILAIPPGTFPNGGLPSSSLYVTLARCIGLEQHESILRVLENAGLVKVSGYYVTLTDAGVTVQKNVMKALLDPK